MVTKIYFSREDRIADLSTEDSRIDGDLEKDSDRVEDGLQTLLNYADELEGKVVALLDTMESFEDPDELDAPRREAVESWALTQAALSRLAWVLRIDGNDAYERLISSMKHANPLNMEGL